MTGQPLINFCADFETVSLRTDSRAAANKKINATAKNITKSIENKRKLLSRFLKRVCPEFTKEGF